MNNRMLMHVRKKKYLHVEFIGEIDSIKARSYRYDLVSLLEENDFKSVLFDFSQVSYIDSSGIGLILGRYNQIVANQGTVYLLVKSPLVHHLFELSGLFKIMEEVVSIKQWERKAGSLYESHGSKL